MRACSDIRHKVVNLVVAGGQRSVIARGHFSISRIVISGALCSIESVDGNVFENCDATCG